VKESTIAELLVITEIQKSNMCWYNNLQREKKLYALVPMAALFLMFDDRLPLPVWTAVPLPLGI
jgi:hypothetical protein